MVLPFLICGAAATLAAGGYQYAGMWPESQLFGPTLIAGKDTAELALTYDDGPNEPYTLQLLEVLERHGVHATFFMIGDYVRQKPSIVRAVRQQGHAIGSHTMTHPHLMYASRSRLRSEMQDCAALIEDTLGEPVPLFRPPFGSRRPEVLRCAAELGLTPVMWNVTGFDWNAKSARAIEFNIERGIVHNQNRGCGTNVLLHDGSHQGMGADRRRTVSATATLLGMLPRTGMHPVTVDHWLQNEPRLRSRTVSGSDAQNNASPIPFPLNELSPDEAPPSPSIPQD
jgi:peptidoglycan/xylan/chitin deacetylase (PgdA/CDA1 family)